MTHPWASARPLSPSERLKVLKDWPALDPYGFHAVGLKALGDFEDATFRILDAVWKPKRRGRLTGVDEVPNRAGDWDGLMGKIVRPGPGR